MALTENLDTPVDFTPAPEPVEFTSFVTLGKSCEIPIKSAFPRIHHWLALKLTRKLSTAVRQKEEIMTKHLQEASDKFAHNNVFTRKQAASSLELMVLHELQLAKDENRTAEIVRSRPIRDELLGLIVAGHDTTGNTTLWALKHLTDEKEIQQNIRTELQAAFPEVRGSGKNPSIQDLVSANLPYLDAFIEESHRVCNVIGVNIRRAIVDTQVLGYPIKAGTDVFMLTTGPDYNSAPLPLDESQRSKTSHEIKDRYGAWDPEDIKSFKPERWLLTSEDGNMSFNPRAGPVHAFGAGARGCFGRRLASLNLRILIGLIVWNLELKEIPLELASYKATAKVVHEPRMCYVRLAEVRS